MPTLPLPFDEATIREVAREFPTPFYLYDEAAIRENAGRINRAFAWSPGFHNHFAVKATPNPHLLAILGEEGFISVILPPMQFVSKHQNNFQKGLWD